MAMIKKKNEDRIVFIDLDNTIFNNLQIRHTAMKLALEGLNLNRNIKELLGNYELVVDLSDGMEAIGIPNFKHYWNSPQLYAVLTILFTDNEVHKKNLGINSVDQKKFLEEISQININMIQTKKDANNYFQKRIPLNICNKDPVIRKFLKILNEIIDDESFQNSYNIFENNLKFEPYDGVFDLFEELNEQDIKIYIVTEGLTEIQHKKIKGLGLGDFKKVLTTEDASNPFGIKKLRKASSIFINFPRESDNNFFKKRELLLLCLQILNQYSDKSNPHFYSRVIHAVVKNPENPSAALKQFSFIPKNIWQKKTRLRLAMIGDRYDKDLKPLILLLGRNSIMTVRLKKAKHWKKDPSHLIDKNLRPTLTTRNFEEIKRYILAQSNWKKLHYVPYPELINKSMIKISSDHLEYSKGLKLLIIKKIFNIIKTESLLN